MDSYGTCPNSAYLDERLDGASTFTRVFFAAVMMRCNDIGLFEADARSFALGLGGADPTDVEDQFVELERRGLIARYRAPGRQRLVGEVLRFHEFEGHPNRVAFESQRTKSTLPYRDGTFFDGARRSRDATDTTSPTTRKRSPTPANTAQERTKDSQESTNNAAQDNLASPTTRKRSPRTRKDGAAPTVDPAAQTHPSPSPQDGVSESHEDLTNRGLEPPANSLQEPAKFLQDSIAERSEAERSSARATLASLATPPNANSVAVADSPTDALGSAPLASGATGDLRPETEAPTHEPTPDPDRPEHRRATPEELARLKAEHLANPNSVLLRPKPAIVSPPPLTVIDGGLSVDSPPAGDPQGETEGRGDWSDADWERLLERERALKQAAADELARARGGLS